MESLLRNLIFQLLIKFSQYHLLHELILSARLNEKTFYARSMKILWTLLTRMLQKNVIVFCILDGLDECNNTKFERNVFIIRFVNTFEQHCSRARVIAISQLKLAESTDNQLH